jgi:hypothetical protein
MHECQLCRMEKLPSQPLDGLAMGRMAQLAVAPQTVERIAHNRMPDVSTVNPNLVGPPRLDPYLKQSHRPEPLLNHVVGTRRASAGVYRHLYAAVSYTHLTLPTTPYV